MSYIFQSGDVLLMKPTSTLADSQLPHVRPVQLGVPAEIGSEIAIKQPGDARSTVLTEISSMPSMIEFCCVVVAGTCCDRIRSAAGLVRIGSHVFRSRSIFNSRKILEVIWIPGNGLPQFVLSLEISFEIQCMCMLA
ncbi:hypothetical protein M758_1G303400 [Ceratodon purpureus]|nr:hypothetical protein M758_1G303400 [Ceratodon purpureus]